MLYRKSEDGNYEAVLESGRVIPFENRKEMCAFIRMREDLCNLLGVVEPVTYDLGEPQSEFASVPQTVTFKKRVKIRKFKGKYVPCGGRLVKCAAV